MFFYDISKNIDCQMSKKSILTLNKFIKITTVYDKMLTICEKFREKAATWHALQKKEIDGWKLMCTMD